MIKIDSRIITKKRHDFAIVLSDKKQILIDVVQINESPNKK